MRLIFINPNPLPSPDPPSLQVIQTAVALAKTRADIHLIVCRGLKESPDIYYNLSIPDGLHLHFLPGFRIYRGPFRFSWNLPFFFSSLLKIICLLKRQKADAILIRNLKLGHFLLRWSRFYKKLPPIIFEIHEIFILSYQDDMDRKGKHNLWKEKKLAEREQYVYENSDGLICTSNYLSNMIREKFKIKGNILAASNGIDLKPFLQNNKSSSNDKNIKPGKTILYIGSLHHWKGLDILLKAVQYLPDINLLIVGGNHESIRRYQILARELKVNKRVHFEGFVPPGKKIVYFYRAHICVLPLKPISVANVSSSLKIFEYMASGRPIVASDLPTLREVLHNNVNSILVTPNNPNSLADGIRRLLYDPGLRTRLSQQARLDVQKYTWDKRADKIRNFISQMAD